MQQDFSAQADLARKQRLAVAHIRTEAVCEAELDRRRTQGEATDAAARWLYTPEALTWLQRSAEQDYAEAQYNLGMAYYGGVGTAPNRELALLWMEKAAAQGLQKAVEMLARWKKP